MTLLLLLPAASATPPLIKPAKRGSRPAAQTADDTKRMAILLAQRRFQYASAPFPCHAEDHATAQPRHSAREGMRQRAMTMISSRHGVANAITLLKTASVVLFDARTARRC